MAKPVGVTSKLKKNDNKHPRVREERMKAKKLGRPKQVFVDTRVSPEEFFLMSDAEILALPKPWWEKVSQ